MDQVYEEVTVTDPDGLVMTPFISGMAQLKQAAPGVNLKKVSNQGGRSAAKLPAATRWVGPLLGFMDEECSGVGLQPFANLRSNDTVYHTGLDVGACLDGAGYYAIADGVVRFVYSGSDMGTLIVTQHHVGGGETVNAIYMHGGPLVFVKAGEQISCGQLLGTMGLSFSAENGGHFGHLHFGLYPGDFSATHNFGYRAVSAGLADWHDPAAWLPPRVERSAPVLPPLSITAPDLERAVQLARSGEYGKAWKAADRLSDGEDAEAAGQLLEALEEVVPKLLARAASIRDAGYPTDALDFLGRQGKACKGLPDGKQLSETAREWKKDRAFKAAIKGEGEILRVAAQQAAVEKKGGVEAVLKLWQDLLQRHDGTILAPRIKEVIDRLTR
jgi:murein DD-endopeptidase MepM/ murein hydrolase activator NlpD